MGNVGFKGFKKGLVCRDKQYAENTVFEEERAEICDSGMHYCHNPFDVLEHYGFVNDDAELNEFATVEPLAEEKTNDNKKFCTTKLKVGAKLSIHAFVDAFVEFTFKRVKKESAATNTGYMSAATNTGYRSAATNTGDRSAATNTGDMSAATNTGDMSAATNTGDMSAATNTGYMSAATVQGKDSVAIAWGCGSKAKGAKGCYLVLAEYDDYFNLINAKMRKVDGKHIKEDTYYKLVDGKFVEVGDE